MSLRRISGAVIACAFVLSACGGDGDPASRTQPTPQRQKLPAGGVWLAVIRIASDPNLLDRDTAQLRKPAGKRLVVAQIECFVGLEEALELEDEEGGEGAEDDTTPGTYVLGVQAKTRAGIRKVLGKIDRTAILVTGVVDRCRGS